MQRVFFTWIYPIMRKDRLSVDDIENIPDDIQTKPHYKTLIQSWEDSKHRGNYALLRIILSYYKWKIFALFIIQLIITFGTTLQQLLLKEILSYIESDNADQKQQIRALTFAITMLTYIFLSKIINENAGYYVVKFEVQLRQAITSMMYSKVLRVSPSTNKKFEKGRLVNMIQNDANSITFVFEDFPQLLAEPFHMIFIIISLYFLIDYLVVIAVVLVIISTFINYLIAKWNASVQRVWLKYIDRRIHKISESIDNIKIIKFN